MNTTESEKLIRYAMRIYPSFKLDDQQIIENARLWSYEFISEEYALVCEAFRLAMEGSPTWMPTIPEVKCAIKRIYEKPKPKTEEELFMDSHCGKTRQQWESIMAWEKSEDGARKVLEYKQRLNQILGARK